ncbi:hypothetical protein AAVH_06121 [Aphelenchoides avenae]|nr:hypothetical protein AAVH_06121 [Aphelenchus avenae]
MAKGSEIHPGRKNGIHSITFTKPVENPKEAIEAQKACVVPLFPCLCKGKKQPPKTPVDGVRMKCTHAKCPFAESSYVHKECYEKLEEHLTDVLHKTGPGRGWSRKVCRINVWMRGLPYLQKFLRCRCEKGLVVLDRDHC